MMARLGGVIEQIRGVSYRPSDLHENLSDESVILLRANNIQNGEIVLDDVVYVSKSKVSEDQYLRRGDILVCTSSGSKELVGKAAFIDEDLPMVFGAFCKVVRPKIECCEYMGHFFQSPYYRNHISAVSAGANINNLRNEHIADLHIPLPPLDKQRKIAAVLDKVCDLIAKRRQQLDKLDEMVKARFVEMFGDVIQNTKQWPQYVFSDITTSRLGKMLDAKQQTGMCQYPYLANFNVQWFRFELDSLNKMDFDEAERIEFELCDGDLLVCEGGEIGRCAVWHNEIQPCYFQKALHRVRCKKEIVMPDYLAWWFKYNCDNKGFAAIEGAKATISHLPGAKLKSLLVAVPPIEQQKQFATFVEQTEKTKTTINCSLEMLEMLKKALMQEYFG